jgi:hypothetical protein
MTKQILAFLFCFIRELNPYSPLTFSLTSAHLSAHTFSLRLEPLGSIKPLVLPSAHTLNPLHPTLKSLYSIAKKHGDKI